MREKLLDLLKDQKNKGMSVEQLADKLGLDDSVSFKLMLKELNSLETCHSIVRDKKEHYFLSEHLGYVIGTLRINPKGFGFVETIDASFYINRDNLNLGMDKDVVFARSWTNSDESVEGEIVEVIEHNTTHIVGVVKVKDGETYFLPDTQMNNRKITVSNFSEFKLVNDSKVMLRIMSYGPVLKCRIETVLGHKYDPGIDILSILLERDIVPEFPEDVMKEVQSIPAKVSKEDKKDRSDLTNLLTITIDGEDAKDLDDAISVEKIEGGYRLGVHIADVSHYVKEGSALDREAYERATSVYVVDRVVPMLPHALSNGICSLNPKVERLTMTCMMDIDKKGEVSNYQIFPSVIKTIERMTYKQVNQILDGNRKVQTVFPHLLKMCMDMQVLSTYIRKRRVRLGSIDFDSKEAKVIVNERGKPIDIVLRERGEAERIIEDFMIAANECVATHVKWLETPSMYRIHESPEPKKIREFARIAKSLGYNFQGGTQQVFPAQLQELLAEAKGQDNYSVLSTFMLRSMQKARYDNRCLGHFGLGLQEYLHYTSPIRRYPDLIVHRMLKKYVFTMSEDVEKMKNDETWCESAANHCSDRERRAVDAERTVDDMKKAEYMEQYIGHVFNGVVSGITKFGMFVELDNTVEGLVHISTLEDDYYHYDDMAKALIGERTAKTYTMGQAVRIKCTDASRFKREIDFAVVAPRKKKAKYKA